MTVSQPVEPESDWSLEEERALFEMANLYPEDTGLPMTVWVSPRGTARHDARVKVCMVHGNRMTVDNLAVMSVRPEPKLLHGELAPKDERAVAGWIRLNEDVLIAYWNGEIGTGAMVRGLQKV